MDSEIICLLLGDFIPKTTSSIKLLKIIEASLKPV